MRGPAPTLGPQGDANCKGQPTGSPQDHSQAVLSRCESLGFALYGVAPVQDSPRAEHLRQWLSNGKHGSMAYLAEELAIRSSPGRVFEGAKSFIVVADQYEGRGDVAPAKPAHGRIARYARGRDYHITLKKRLHTLADDLRLAYPGSDFRTCVDTAPVPERELAELAGLGWIGKNTMLINPRVGSWFVLGIVATNLELAPTPAEKRIPDHCGTCTRCIDACPTSAITPYSVDASRCISYLTIEHREAIPPSLARGMGDWVFGCDVCQEVCPHNSPREHDTGTPHEAYAPKQHTFDLLNVLNWDEPARRDAFSGTAMKRITLAMMKRNAIIAAGNAIASSFGAPHGSAVAPQPADPAALAALRTRITELAADPTEPTLVRDTARDVLSSLPC